MSFLPFYGLLPLEERENWRDLNSYIPCPGFQVLSHFFVMYFLGSLHTSEKERVGMFVSFDLSMDRIARPNLA